MKRLTLNDFVVKSKRIHGDKYDYSKTVYVNSRVKVEIICPIHGTFLQKAGKHLLGCGCCKCGHEKVGENCRFTQDEFLHRCNKIHNNTYDYSHVKYVDCRRKIQIGCKKHGLFFQSPVAHIHQKQGCPKCKRSRGELIVEGWLRNRGIFYVTQKTFEGLTNGKRGWGLRYDFYLPTHNILIEVDGIGHYPCGIGRWVGRHKISNHDYEQTKKNDKIKTLYAKKNNINLIRIPYTNCKDTKNLTHALNREI